MEQMKSLDEERATMISVPIIGTGLLLGLLLSWGVLSGDAQGRVNIGYLLFVYLLVPLTSLIVSVISLALGRGVNLARLAAHVPLWSPRGRTHLHQFAQRGIDKPWFFLQSQAAAVAFSLASLAVFFLQLLFTDVNFVWRSTLLSADALLPLLQAIAVPWWFWPEAQPSLSLLQATQDSRLQGVTGDVSAFARWWPFILATQLCYGLLLRGLLFLAALAWLLRQARRDAMQRSVPPADAGTGWKSGPDALAPVTEEIATDVALVNWAGVDEALLQQLPGLPGVADASLQAGPLADELAQQEAERWPGQQLLVLKAWEPPMGELSDYLQHTRGYLLPIDWRDGRLCAPRRQHLDEWRYFVRDRKGWQIYQPPMFRAGS